MRARRERGACTVHLGESLYYPPLMRADLAWTWGDAAWVWEAEKVWCGREVGVCGSGRGGRVARAMRDARAVGRDGAGRGGDESCGRFWEHTEGGQAEGKHRGQAEGKHRARRKLSLAPISS